MADEFSNYCPVCAHFDEQHRNTDGDGIERIEGLCRFASTPRVKQKDDYCTSDFVAKE